MVKLKLFSSLYFVARFTNHLLTVSIGSLCSTLKNDNEAIDVNQKKAIFQDNKC